MLAGPRVVRTLLMLSLILISTPFLFAQQTGSISGRVTATDGSALPGVTVEARATVLPQPRVTNTDGAGDFRFPGLIPGSYTLSFNLAGMQSATRRADVQLGQNTVADVALGLAGVAESITVTAEASLVDKESTEIKSGLSSEDIQQLPVSQEYRDLQKLIPGVQVTQDVTRGPSAGGSGQDNVYMFDGVNVTMPLFGVLVAEPSTHDIAQVTVLKGGAKAVDFERAGGFSIDSVSKSGTNEYTGQVSYQTMRHDFIAEQDGTQNSRFDQDRAWTVLNLGGPVLRDRLFFYGSYYHPNYTRDNVSNLTGAVPGYELDRTEWFGKLTASPTSTVLFNGSYRTSHREETGDQFASTSAGTIGFGYETKFQLATLEGSWVINPRAFASFKVTDFRNPGGGSPDHFSSAVPSFTIGTQLDVNNLDTQGLLTVPTLIAGNTTQNAFVQPYLDKYGYTQDGVRKGGGLVGFASLAADDDDFFRKNGQVAFDYNLGTNITHDLHFGYQYYEDSEDRLSLSNGWGSITIPGGSINCPASAIGCAGKPVFFQAVVKSQTTGAVPIIHSEIHSQNIELNDTIRMNDWTFNAGVLVSSDTLYGQGLKKADNIAGYVSSPGTPYLMHKTPFKDMIQPRLGVTWAYNSIDTVFASFARYNPAANSDARAASWDRNLISDVNVYFGADGKVIGNSPVASSSGKWWQEGIKPRQTFEYMIGTGQQFGNNLSVRVYGRHRKSDRFWEDTNNNARIAFGSNVPGVEQALYIPNLGTVTTPGTIRNAIGSGSSYVIAELDGAFTKYYEGTIESDWRRGNTTLRGSYTWSHYYGNFDQDNTNANTANDAAIFIGSSFIADGAGRQMWDFKYGDLRGDRRHVAKFNGIQSLPWHATLGAFAVYQSGQPYQLESFLPYRGLTTSTSDTNRYAEPAGRRRAPAHHQLDLNYTQNFGLPRGFNLQLLVDIFNVYDKQTGYNYETRVGSLGFTADPNVASVEVPNSIVLPASAAPGSRIRAPFAKSFYDPRKFQLAVRFQF